jgi:hypothetical protein
VMLAAFAIAADLCCTMAGFKCCASKRGFRDRFLVSIPLGAPRYIDKSSTVAAEDRLKWAVLLLPRPATPLTDLDKSRLLGDSVHKVQDSCFLRT